MTLVEEPGTRRRLFVSDMHGLLYVLSPDGKTVSQYLDLRIVFGDMPSGDVFHVGADTLPNGGQDAIRRVLFVTGPGATPRPALEIIQEKNRTQGKTVAPRADLRFDVTAAGRIVVLNKADGMIRVMER